MAGRRGLGVIALTALAVGGCTYTWGGGEQTGPTWRTGCSGTGASTYRPRVSGLYDGMPAPPGDPDRPLFSAICTESP